MLFLEKVVRKLKYWLLALLMLPFLWSRFTYANGDLMSEIMEPANRRWTTIHLSDTAKGVGRDVFEQQNRLSIDSEGAWAQKIPSIIVKLTRILLSLVVALSVTMILYNGLTYIIQTGQWKEWKDLVKNVVYIVIWILVSLFSVTIITLLQSVSTTLDKDTLTDWHRDADDKIVYDARKWISWEEIKNTFNKWSDD